ncbi:MAG: hypothetical protein LBB81_10425 [Treponema sp.]|nr:hypothetical protein [Treponema sp.]
MTYLTDSRCESSSVRSSFGDHSYATVKSLYPNDDNAIRYGYAGNIAWESIGANSDNRKVLYAMVC